MNTETSTAFARTSYDRTVPLLFLGAVGTLFFICAAAFFVYYNTKQLIASRDLRDHSQEVLSTLAQTSQRLDRIDYSIRLYQLDQDKDDLGVAQNNAISLDTMLFHLEEIVSDNPAQRKRAGDLHSCVSELKRLVDTEIPQDLAPQTNILTCRNEISKLMEAERMLLTSRTNEAQRNIYRSAIAGAAFLLVSLSVVSTLFAFLLRDARRRRTMDQQIFSTNTQLEANVLMLQKRAAESSLLMSAREELQLCMNLAQAHEAIVRYCKQLLPSVYAVLFVLDDSHQILSAASAPSKESHLLNGFPVDACCGLRSGKTRWRKPGQSEVHCDHFIGTPPENYLCLPLIAHGDTFGILYIECPTPLVAIDVESNYDSLEALTEMAAMSLAGLHLRSRLEQQSIRDGLTHLFNRRFMETALNRELSFAQRNHASLSLLMIDIDHFKKYNDTYGHEAGDLILREVAEIFRKSVREEDALCRYGGEEFVILLPDTSEEAAVKKAESLLQNIRDLQVATRDNSRVSITVSIGVATFPQAGTTSEELLRNADRALYAAKREGRNRVMLANTSEVVS